MQTIFVVSPDYLTAVLKEAKGYSFLLQGYGSFSKAVQGIVRVNAIDIIGIGILCEKLPQANTDEYEKMLEFLYRCDLMESSLKVLFLVKSGIGSAVKELRKFKNVEIYAHTGFELVTDTLINKNLFGSLLKNKFKPYVLKEEKREPLGSFSGPILEYKPLVSDQLLSCISKVSLLESYKHTIEFDSVFISFMETKSCLAYFRSLFIKMSFPEEDKTSEISVIEKYLADLREKKDPDWCMLLALYDFILTGGDLDANAVRF